MTKPVLLFLSIAASALLPASVFAGEQIYRPTNPTFGGNALNGSFLLSTAQAQGKGVKSGQQSPDLSGLNEALSNIGNNTGSTPVVVIGGNGLPVVPSNP
ncbi:curli assembly protein CsgF [Bosea sp. BK604]|uniref:curli assembly protein CsgF n=1 Tax=Bosea sp. BK604 TaxID=2512180 RepID=UPI00104EFCA4|nr:curli assembly protein CsgF [Bosea sp. BK604]TCR63111.1 curli production assembly/transport component CsgF [Bosea sp. BK604]